MGRIERNVLRMLTGRTCCPRRVARRVLRRETVARDVRRGKGALMLLWRMLLRLLGGIRRLLVGRVRRVLLVDDARRSRMLLLLVLLRLLWLLLEVLRGRWGLLLLLMLLLMLLLLRVVGMMLLVVRRLVSPVPLHRTIEVQPSKLSSPRRRGESRENGKSRSKLRSRERWAESNERQAMC